MLRYAVIDHGGTFDDSFEFAVPAEALITAGTLRHFACEAAANFHDEHDGWESTWPLLLELYAMDGGSLGRYQVQREMLPTFNAKPA
jgi:hypothetical protein